MYKKIFLNYICVYLIFSLIIGGATAKSIYTDFILHILSIPFIIYMFYDFRFHKLNPIIWVILFITLSIFSIQLFPFPTKSEGWQYVTRDFGRTLDSLLFFTACLAVFYVVYRKSEETRTRFNRFFLLGVGLNFVVAVLQFASAGAAITNAGFPYTLAGGFFANPNHLSALLYVSIPFFLLSFRNTRLNFMSYVIVFAIIWFELVVASMAGVLLSFACVLVSITWLSEWRILRWATLGVAFLFAIAALFFVPVVLDAELAGDLNRRVFALNTLRAIGDYWSLGSGFGTFTLIYPSYEVQTGIFDEFVNHAHNDYLELILEGGIMFVAALFLYAMALLLKLIFGRIENQQKVALLGIVFLLLHSLVDYPLRTMALAVTFSFLNGLYFAPIRRLNHKTHNPPVATTVAPEPSPAKSSKYRPQRQSHSSNSGADTMQRRRGHDMR